jgi:hypothetical protein
VKTIQAAVGIVAASTLRRGLELLGVDAGRPETLPFGPDDVTAGSESELQAAVLGERSDVDLPLAIEQSSFFANSIRRAEAGDTSRRIVSDLEGWLESNREKVWDNSFVRLPRRTLSAYADSVFRERPARRQGRPGEPAARRRRALHRPRERRGAGSHPHQLSAQAGPGRRSGRGENPPDAVRGPGVRLMGCFLNDNTSPETLSFHTPRLRRETGGGAALARESAKRYLFSQLLIAYSNEVFELKRRGQTALLYSSPHPPVRQRQLNDCVSDSFYRELLHEPLPVGLGSRRAEARLHGAVPPDAFAIAAQRRRQAARGRA